MVEWKTIPLSDYATVKMGQSPPSEYYNDEGQGMPFIQGNRNFQNKYTNYDTYTSKITKKAEKGDVLLSVRAPVGDVNLAPQELCIGRGIAALTSVDDDNEFLFYLLKTVNFSNYESGTIFGSVNKNTIESLEVSIPVDKEYRMEIGHQLSLIDNLIDINSSINDYLLELSKSILSFHIFKEETMLVNLGELVDVIDCLHSKKPELIDEGKLFLQLGNIRDDGLLDVSRPYFISDEDYKLWTSRCEVREGDCVITNVGRIGAVSQVPWYVRAAMGRNMTCIRCKNNFNYPAFLITSMLSDYMCQEIMLNTDEGTILGALNVRSIPKLQVIKFDDTTMMKIESLLKPIRHQMEVLLVENNELKKIRDSMIAQIMR